MLNAMDMTVAGLYTTGLTELDQRMLKMHLASAARLAETDRVSAILVSLVDPRALPGVGHLIAQKLANGAQGLRVLDWPSRAPFYAQVRSLYSGIFVFLGGLIFLLVTLSNSNALLMAMMERVNEIGTLRALGTGRGQVGALFLFEALWLGLLGALLGALLGLGASVVINALGVELPPPPGGVNPMLLRVTPAVPDFLLAAVVMLVVMAVSALLPILRATRLQIVDALGHV
jgi:putative ABC transport system permease protein